jgi:hypothetical protein
MSRRLRCQLTTFASLPGATHVMTSTNARTPPLSSPRPLFTTTTSREGASGTNYIYCEHRPEALSSDYRARATAAKVEVPPYGPYGCFTEARD